MRAFRFRRCCAVFLASLLVVPTALASPAQAYTEPTFSMSPTVSGPTGTIALASVAPCPAVEQAGDTMIGRVQLYRWTGRGFWTSFRPANADGSWAWNMTLPTSYLTNGRYIVAGECDEMSPQDTSIDDAYPVQDYVPLELDIQSPSGQPDPVTRLGGADRVDTSIAISHDLFDDNHAYGAVLARADTYADAVAGTPLAAAFYSPLLLTPGDSLDPRTAQELGRVIGSDKSAKTVFILGGTGAVSQHVEDQLKDLSYRVVRIGGLNRYATAARVAATFTGFGASLGRILLADGNDFHDGLVAGAAARSELLSGTATGPTVVLLTDGGRMPAETASAIQANQSATLFAIGQAAWSAAPGANGIIGADPAETSAAVARHFFSPPRVVSVASLGSFADALSGGLHAAMVGAPLVYVAASAIPTSVGDYLDQNAPTIVRGYAYGGTAAVSEDTVAEIGRRISG